MISKNKPAINTSLSHDLNIAKELVYDTCGWDITDLKLTTEGAGKGACSFCLNGFRIQHRVSNITPKKTGQFVSIWKRNQSGITEPYSLSDDVHFIIITSKNGDKLGQFIFPKSVLAENGILTQNGKEGKRGIRVYLPGDVAPNKQAAKTQAWQIKYFIEIEAQNATAITTITKLLAK